MSLWTIVVLTYSLSHHMAGLSWQSVSEQAWKHTLWDCDKHQPEQCRVEQKKSSQVRIAMVNILIIQEDKHLSTCVSLISQLCSRFLPLPQSASELNVHHFDLLQNCLCFSHLILSAFSPLLPHERRICKFVVSCWISWSLPSAMLVLLGEIQPLSFKAKQAYSYSTF